MKLQDYINYYIGCRVEKDSDALDYPTIKGVHGDRVMISEYRYKTPHADGVFTRPEMYQYSDFVKPILRRLEDMTEEEMIQLIQIMVPDEMEDKPTDEEYILNLFHNDDGNLVNCDVAIGAEYNVRCYEGQLTIKKCGTICAYDETGDEQELVNAPKAYHYLLSKHFDLFGLIDAGIAIDAKTLNP